MHCNVYQFLVVSCAELWKQDVTFSDFGLRNIQDAQYLCSTRSLLLDCAATWELRPVEGGEEISIESEGSYMDKSS